MRVLVPYLLLTLIPFTGFVACGGSSTDDTVDSVVDVEETTGEDATLLDAEDTATADAADSTDDLPLDVCVPQCDGLKCGPDGCGGQCGECPIYATCVAGDCCMADCEGKECGADGCGGQCGECEFPGSCVNYACCMPDCDGKECGPDGCGGWCGMCEENSLCIDTLCLLDSDQDGVPNEADIFPNNPDLPGVAEPQTVYAHTDQTLFKMDVKLYLLEEVHDFVWSNDGGAHYVTDIGFDRYGVLYAVTFENLYTCHPQTGVCTLLGDLPEEFNGLTLIPKGYLDPFKDVMVGISEDGGWYRLSVHNGTVEAIKLGEYGGPYTSAGDSYSIMGVGTFAAVHKSGASSDYLVSVNPSNGEIIEEIGPIEGYTGIFGLAGWSGKAYAFDKKGDVVLIDTTTGEIELLHSTEHSWWGAGVATLLN